MLGGSRIHKQEHIKAEVNVDKQRSKISSAVKEVKCNMSERDLSVIREKSTYVYPKNSVR